MALEAAAHTKIVFLIVGESASGKDSLANMLCENLGLKKVVSYTTRPRRIGESEDSHVFISKDEVEQYRDDMIAYTEINSNFYFATRQQIMDSNLYLIDPTGSNHLRALMKDDNIRFVTIYINTPPEIRRERAMMRGDLPIIYQSRAEDEEYQFSYFKRAAKYDYAVSNIDINKAYQVIKNIIEVETNAETNQ